MRTLTIQYFEHKMICRRSNRALQMVMIKGIILTISLKLSFALIGVDYSKQYSNITVSLLDVEECKSHYHSSLLPNQGSLPEFEMNENALRNYLRCIGFKTPGSNLHLGHKSDNYHHSSYDLCHHLLGLTLRPDH